MCLSVLLIDLAVVTAESVAFLHPNLILHQINLP